MVKAVENPISGLTLPDTLEKHRQEVIYGIKQQIGIGLMTGERYDTMAKNIKRSVFGVDGKSGLYGKSMRIVRTEVHRVQESGLADSAKDIMQGLDGSGLVEVAIWRTMKGERVRPQVRVRNARGKWKTYRSRSGADHQKMEGKAVIVGDKFEIESGVFAECPGKSGTARNDCNCRCFLEYKLVTIEEAAKLTGKSIAEIRKIAGVAEVEEKESADKTEKIKAATENDGKVIENTEKATENKEKSVEKAAKSGIIEVKKKDLSQYIGKAIEKTDNQSIREWYVANVSDIPNQIDKSKPFEEQVRQAYELRNKYKHMARVAMSDEETAAILEKKHPIKTFDELLQDKMKRKICQGAKL